MPKKRDPLMPIKKKAGRPKGSKTIRGHSKRFTARIAPILARTRARRWKHAA